MKINSKIKICGQSMIARAFVCMTVNAHKEKTRPQTKGLPPGRSLKMREAVAEARNLQQPLSD
ncbi:MAG: hypothetical protein IJA93_01700 [Clostridia bacterium]|nr:hypothetical protein [Clostridia bacterium]